MTRKIAVLATDGTEEIELTSPVEALKKAGAEIIVISLEKGEFQAVKSDIYPSGKLKADLAVKDAVASDYDALLLPGGVASPDKLRVNETAVQFVRDIIDAGKPVATICHGSQTLIETGALRGLTVTSWPAIRTDLKNAGATWVDQPVVTDGQFLFSRCPDDLDAFNPATITHFRIT
ncbi:type 1 glutamine amidotransferase domain-containing protein [Acetobacter fallax]|uniref:DJ-1/PfpI/YhbO family deglycase/protease n=1 Tax=Acetobacter fallax TaxID=1737473 RepID=A0ABX0KAZ1_9PROT|nr:type 1 glutamine amidotransferase domain-containing protein [Acetobacter fallax]NHO32922.1 DJ-1/PfpI/YhbO family deglycase/protease [Acetobacter fallax]NHO36543.1 DJ-1/PfpI/YhbO family deglycase/protease [Acetobacter fallax]